MEPQGDGRSLAEGLARVEGQVHALRDEHAGTLRRLSQEIGVVDARLSRLERGLGE